MFAIIVMWIFGAIITLIIAALLPEAAQHWVVDHFLWVSLGVGFVAVIIAAIIGGEDIPDYIGESLLDRFTRKW